MINVLKLKDFREDRDLTQKEIAEILNCQQNTYQQYECEKRQIPLDALKKLALFYHTSIDCLVGLTDEVKPYPRMKKN